MKIVNPLHVVVEKCGQRGTCSSHSEREKSTEKHLLVSEGISWEPRIISVHTGPQKIAKNKLSIDQECHMMVAERVKP